MGISFLWEFHGKRPMGWDGTGINCYAMGMGQINMSHGQPCYSPLTQFLPAAYVTSTVND